MTVLLLGDARTIEIKSYSIDEIPFAFRFTACSFASKKEVLFPSDIFLAVYFVTYIFIIFKSN